ncbi:MAG TPA: PhzF family phenazine biosynthesis protein [Pedococcus sp.]
MRLQYRLLNVFARPADPFSGNPLCVFEDGSSLSDAQMQGLARQFNLSETTFVVPAGDGADAGVRIFTTAYEMSFAGHPTLGTAHAVRAMGRGGDLVTLSMPAGSIPVAAQGDTWTLTAVRGQVRSELDADRLAAALGLEPGDLLTAHEVSTGTTQVVARARDVDAVGRARVVPSEIAGYARMGVSGGEVLVYVWAQRDGATLEARALVSDGQVAGEDPATGSACVNLGTLFAAAGRRGEWTIEQGARVGRPSTLHLSVDGAGTVRVGGLVHEVGQGGVAL